MGYHGFSRRWLGLPLAVISLLTIFVLPGLAATTKPSRPAPKHPRLTIKPPYKAVWGPNRIGGGSAFPTYRQLGMQIYSTALHWGKIAQRKPTHPTDPNDLAYRWPASVDAEVHQALEQGMRVSIELTKAPSWANGGRTSKWYPLNPKDYADFAVAASRRYPGVRLWMIWGEPNRVGNFMPQYPANGKANRLTRLQAQAPRAYARLLDAAYAALKGENPNNLIIGGSTFTGGDIRTPLWIRYMRLPNGKPPRLDLYSHNPFFGREPNLANKPLSNNRMDISSLPLLEKLVVDNLGLAYGKRMVPLFLSEICIPTHAGDMEFHGFVSPALQAIWIKKAWNIVSRQTILGGKNYVYSLGWIHLSDSRTPKIGSSYCGLLDLNGKPKPGFQAWAGLG